MKIRARLIMFDFDGTIADTKDDIAASANHVLNRVGRAEKPVDEIAGYIGDGLPTLLRRLLGVDEEADVSEAIKTFRAHYFDHCLDKTRAYPGVGETLQHFKGKNLTIVTNKPKVFTDKILQGLGLSHHFTMVVGGDGAYAKKPSPEAFLAVLEALKIPATEALVVGDSPNDINGGRAAGCVTCAVTYGLGTRAALEAASPDFTVNSMPGLREIVE